MKRELKERFKQIKKSMMEEIIQKEIKYERKKESERLARGEPIEQSKLKRFARRLDFRLRVMAQTPTEGEIMEKIHEEDMIAEAKLTEYERKAKQEAQKQKRREAIPKKVAYALAGYALLVNISSFGYAALSLTEGKTKSEVENEIKLDRQYLVNGLWLGDEFTPPYPDGYEPKESEAYVTEETYEWIKSQPPAQPLDPNCKTKTKYIIIKKDETGKEYLDLKPTPIEIILKNIFLNFLSKPGRELAYKVIK